MIYKFIDDNGTFTIKNPQKYNLYFPLTNRGGNLLSSISPNLAGDIKKDNEHFLTIPASIEDIRSSLLCRRDFFIKINKGTIRLSQGQADMAEYGFLYQKIAKQTKEFSIEIINFIPHNLAAEIMWVKIINKSSKKLDITPTSFIPLYGRAEKNLRDHRHVNSLLNRVELHKYGIMLKPTMVFDETGHKENRDIYFALGYEGKNNPALGQFPTLDSFYGQGDIISADAIESNLKPFRKKLKEFDGKETCAALRFKNKKLDSGQEADYFLLLGIAADKQAVNKIFNALNTPQKVKNIFAATKKYWLGYLGGLSLDFKDKSFNNWLLWVRLQPSLRKLFGCSFLPHFDYGKGGRGWRDLWQDVLSLLLTEPQRAKSLILESFKGVRLDGSNATIITKSGEFIADRNKISRVWMDHGVWPYLAVCSYIHKSGDVNILLKETAYFRDCQLKRSKEFDEKFSQKDYILHTKNKNIYRGTILEHILIQNLVQFFNVGKHNAIRLENADWNDGLDMAAQEGESVTFSFMYAHNLKGLCFFLNELKKQIKSVSVLKELTLLLDSLFKPINYDSVLQRQKRLNEYLEKTKAVSGEKIKIGLDRLISDLSKKSEHLYGWLRNKEWLKEGFFNGYYDNKGRRVEGKFKNSIQMMLPSQVFAIMSGAATDAQIKKIWHSLKRHLYDKTLGGFRLNSDFGRIYPELGRAFGFSYGDKENGAFFNHMAVMLAFALYSRNFVKEGFQAINSIYKMANSLKAKIPPMIPEYFNSQGQGLYLYLTGSASWYNHTLLEQILGIKFILGDLYLEPKLVKQNFYDKTIEIKFSFQNKLIKLAIIKPNSSGKAYKIKEINLAGSKIIQENNTWCVRKETIRKIKQKEIPITVYLH
jgi:cellobiose phosphorylase